MPNEDFLMSEEEADKLEDSGSNPGPVGPPAPPARNPMPPYFQGSLPPTQQHDVHFVGTEVGTPRIPKTALMPIPLQANPATNAAIQSTAQKAGSGGSGTAQSISLSVPNIFTPTFQTKPLPGPLSFDVAQEPEGTVWLSPIPLFGGYGDTRDDFIGGSPDPISATVTSAGDSEVALWFQASDGGSLTFTSPWTNWQNNSTASVNAQYVPVKGTTIAYSGSGGGADYAGTLVLLGAKSLPVITQSVTNFTVLTGGGLVNTGNFPNANIAGNAILVFVSIHNVSGPFDTSVSVSDTHGNVYTPIANVQNVLGTACIVYFCPVIGASPSNSVSALFMSGGNAVATITAFELSPVLQQVNLFPRFAPLSSGFIPPINLALLNQQGGVTGVLPTGNGGTGLAAPGASGNVLTSNGLIWTSAPGGGGGSGLGGVNVQTTNYTLVSGDNAKDVVANSGSTITFTVPATPPSTTWTAFIQNIGAGTLTLDRNGKNIDGAAANVTIPTGQGLVLFTDGTNYFTERGMGSATGVSSLNALTGALSLTSSDSSITITPSGTTIDLIAVGGGGGGLTDVNGETGPSITIAGGTGVTVATTTNTVTISSTGGGGFPTQAGVPTSSTTKGSLIGVTDGAIGAALYSFVGAYSGLPLVVNWGTAGLSATGALTVNMLRNITLGNLLVACIIQNNGSIGNTPNSGWSSILSNGSPTPAIAVIQKVATVTEAGSSSVTPWSSATLGTGVEAFVVEISNFDTVTPIVSSTSGNDLTGPLTGLSPNQLVLQFAGVGASNGTAPVNRTGYVPLGFQACITANSGVAWARAVPLIDQVMGPGGISQWIPYPEPTGSTRVGANIVIGLGAGTTNFWAPIG